MGLLAGATDMMVRVGRRIDRLTPAGLFVLTFVLLFTVYLPTSTRSLPYHIDPFSNVLPAWSLGTRGTLYLDGYEHLTRPEYYGKAVWLVDAQGRAVSQYPPGTALFATPFYWLAGSDAQEVTVDFRAEGVPDRQTVPVAVPPLWPAALAASIAVSVAMACLAVVFAGFVTPRAALAGALVAGLGTSAWSVAADALWQHGPAILFLSLALLFISREKYLPAGLAFAVAILIRPPTALIAAAAGILTARKLRSWRVLLGVGGSALGLVAVLVYNSAVFSNVTIAGGYGSSFVENAASGDTWSYVVNVAGGLFDPEKGFLIWSPFLLILLPGLPRAWKTAPAWVKGSALGGLLYILVQYKANRFSGGTGFFTYRYPLEMLAASAPLLMLAYREWIAPRALISKLLRTAALASITIHAVGSVI